MTPEELYVRYSPLTAAAQRLLEALAPPMSGEERREVVVRYFIAVVADAREACAKLADENDGQWITDGHMIARAIRALA